VTAARQPPYYYPFKHGDAEITVVSDGPLPLGNPAANFVGASPAEIAAMLNRNFLPPDDLVLEQNAAVVKLGSRTMLFETGMGTLKLFGETTGRLLESMKEAGIKPSEIDAVVCSHAHIDHVGGVCDDSGHPYFPNAEVFINEEEFKHWTDESRLNSDFGVQVANARKNLLPVKDRLSFFKDGQEFLPGVQAMAVPGHTMGHHCFIVSSAGKSFCLLGDTTHHQVLLLEKPWMNFAYDADPKLSAKSRIRVLDMVATDRIPVMAYHFAWPGFGHVGRDGDGFRYFPAPMQLLKA
jgi:glyoxylase-like metal-dependent hydrolase (beta-lactamase superfamily II)